MSEEKKHSDEQAETQTETVETPTVEAAPVEDSSNEWKEKYLRCAADLENFRRRMVKERALWSHTAQAGVLVDIIPALDDFDRALAESQDNEQVKQWLTGMELIRKQLQKMLEKHGVTAIEGTSFDPELHEALAQVDSDEHESGAIVEVYQKGYLLKDKVLRPAKVSVAK